MRVRQVTRGIFIKENVCMKNELARYMIVGALALMVDTTVFLAVVNWAHYDYRIALCCGFLIGVFVNFCLCDRYVFHRTDCSFARACARHYGASVTGLALSQLGMTLLMTTGLCTWLLGARIIVATFTFLCNFALIRFFVFRLHNKA